MLTLQVPVPEQLPPHPAKTEVEDETAVSVMDVFSEKLAEQVEPQLIPDGLLVTVPDPLLPDLSTFSV